LFLGQVSRMLNHGYTTWLNKKRNPVRSNKWQGGQATMIQGGINSESTFCELPNQDWVTVSDSLCNLESTLSIQS